MPISTLAWTKNRVSITGSKLAHEVAKWFNRYLESMAVGPYHLRIPCRLRLTTRSQGHMDGLSTDQQWKIGEGSMDLEHMHLVRLVPVSARSVQPEIWIRTP